MRVNQPERRAGNAMDIILLFCLDTLGPVGTVTLLIITGVIMWRYRNSPLRSFRHHWRNVRLKQLSALACLFFLAMTESYGVLRNALAFIYLIAAFIMVAWWLRLVLSLKA